MFYPFYYPLRWNHFQLDMSVKLIDIHFLSLLMLGLQSWLRRAVTTHESIYFVYEELYPNWHNTPRSLFMYQLDKEKANVIIAPVIKNCFGGSVSIIAIVCKYNNNNGSSYFTTFTNCNWDKNSTHCRPGAFEREENKHYTDYTNILESRSNKSVASLSINVWKHRDWWAAAVASVCW